MFKSFNEFRLERQIQESYEEIFEQQLSALQQEYRDYFKEKLEEFGVDSPAKLNDADKKEFFKSIKAGWVIGKGRK